MSVAPIMLFAAMTSYSTAPLVVLMEIGIAAIFCGLAIFAAAKIDTRHTATSQ